MIKLLDIIHPHPSRSPHNNQIKPTPHLSLSNENKLIPAFSISIYPFHLPFRVAFFRLGNQLFTSNLREDVIQNPKFSLTYSQPPNFHTEIVSSHKHILRTQKYYASINYPFNLKLSQPRLRKVS